jgi:hypothetical protein
MKFSAYSFLLCRVDYIWYLRFYYYHSVDISAGRLLVPEGIIRPIENWHGLLDIFITEIYSY